MVDKVIIFELNDFKFFIKHKAKTTGELRSSFRQYALLVKKYWPCDMDDDQFLLKRLDSALTKLDSFDNTPLNKYNDDSFVLKDEVVEVVNSINCSLFNYYFQNLSNPV
ncbi:hypothetical protein SAMN05660862_2269 [Sphingobacterium psychroaquaticum]|uniref:Uncharacterized protein n=1 Tax=Sphingobacterium psychroaquaticum TaxID=561061 RepID=A0A1X7JW02_9SPHI|nr:hypothetical protein SAMN05660862_2269 [Sphingobacterium psychroaquaticum]